MPEAPTRRGQGNSSQTVLGDSHNPFGTARKGAAPILQGPFNPPDKAAALSLCPWEHKQGRREANFTP